MLNENQTDSSQTSFPAVGFQFHEPNSTDFAPRVGLAYRLGEKTVLAVRLWDLLQPEPDEHVHVPDQQPAAGGGVHVQFGARRPRR